MLLSQSLHNIYHYIINNKNIINSKYCNNTNIIGYPLINNIDEKDGIHYMMCLFSQMALLPEYISLNEKSFTEFTFIERIKTQIKKGNTCEASKLIGQILATRSVEKKITQVIFDRGRYMYHGRVKAVADGAREGGLEF